MKVIDTHSQLWTAEAIKSMPETMREGYIQIFGDNLPTLEDTVNDMDAAGVEKSVLVAIDAETVWDYRVSNELVAEAVSANPDRLIGFASVDPHKGVTARKEHVYFNIAGWAPVHIPKFVFNFMKGPVKEKALLGSDYPLVSRQRIMAELADLDIDDDVRERLYFKNALELIPGLE